MGYDQDSNKRSRIVVPTASRPTSRKSVPKARQPRQTGMRPGTKRAILDASIIVAATLFTTLFLLLISGQLHDTTGSNLSPRAAVPVVSFAPTPTPSRRASATTTPTPSTASPTPTPPAADTPSDATMLTDIKNRIADDASLAALSITAAVTNGKVTLTGSVPTDELRDRFEKLARSVKGVKNVDNKIVVGGGLVRTNCGSGWVTVC